jgi:hypothetical protein
MEVLFGIALGLTLSSSVVLGVYGWDLRALCRRQEKELWALRQALRLHLDDDEEESVANPPPVRA